MAVLTKSNFVLRLVVYIKGGLIMENKITPAQYDEYSRIICVIIKVYFSYYRNNDRSYKIELMSAAMQAIMKSLSKSFDDRLPDPNGLVIVFRKKDQGGYVLKLSTRHNLAMKNVFDHLGTVFDIMELFQTNQPIFENDIRAKIIYFYRENKLTLSRGWLTLNIPPVEQFYQEYDFKKLF
jgi:hypothetical protein